jgi:hypothetical protein
MTDKVKGWKDTLLTENQIRMIWIARPSWENASLADIAEAQA